HRRFPDVAWVGRRPGPRAGEDVLGADNVDLALVARRLLALRHAARGLAVFGALLGVVRNAVLHVLVLIVIVTIVGARVRRREKTQRKDPPEIFTVHPRSPLTFPDVGKRSRSSRIEAIQGGI